MEDYRLTQSGQEVQNILNGAAMQSDLTAETERATEAEQTLQGNIDAEATRAQGAEGTLQDNIDAEEARAKAAEKQNADDIDAIDEKIPSGASSSNKLATEEYVNDSVATATATFRGSYNLVSDLHLNVTATEQQIAAALAGAISTADNNDYCFILVPTSSEAPTEIKEIDRYKFNGTAWGFEYKLNNSGFTAAQWAAINSGITIGDVAKLAALPTNAQLTTLLAGLQSDIDGEETRAKGAENTLQDNIDAEETRAKAAEKQNADDIDAIEAVIPENASSENKVATESEINSLSAAIEAILLLIPSAATSLNKLADKAFVNSSIATATATFRGTYNLVDDLGLTTSATHAQIATALAGAILTADNNDYAFVQIPTSDAMPTEIAKTERYKFNGTAWEYEYDLNNSGFTSDQWAAINSGITQALVTKLSDLPTNAELTTELGTLTSGITTINQKIPNAASQANKLIDTATMKAYIVQVLDVLTISYNVTSTDGHVTFHIEQVDGKITSVTLATSDIASEAALNLKASQADLTALASRVTTAEGNITTLGGRMTTAEGNITSLGGRMTTAEGNITTINGNITSLGGRVSTNETDIANLQQLYNDLQQSKPVPVTALPETGQQQGVIYRLAGTTSYSDYMWNGSTWVLMATYNNAIDPRPKKASQNLVTSGGVFDNMGALDVSELNATENPHTLAQYTDLSAALAAIPTDYQKGGMSIKFVQSSDNKYVQYRLMTTSFSITPSDWQGVDDILTALTPLTQSKVDKPSKIITVSEGLDGSGIISTELNIYEGSDNHTQYEVTEGEQYIINGFNFQSPYNLYFILDSNNIVLEAFTGERGIYNDVEITIPKNGKYLYVNGAQGQVQSTINKVIYEDVSIIDIKRNIFHNYLDVSRSISKIGICEIVAIGIDNSGIIAINGSVYSSSDDHIEIPVEENEIYYIDGKNFNSTYPLYFIKDSNGQLIESYQGTDGDVLSDYKVYIPANGSMLYVNGAQGIKVAKTSKLITKNDAFTIIQHKKTVGLNGIINIDGTILGGYGDNHIKISVGEGDVYSIRGRHFDNSYPLYYITDNNGVVLKQLSSGIRADYDNYIISVPQNGSFLCVNGAQSVSEANIKKVIFKDITSYIKNLSAFLPSIGVCLGDSLTAGVGVLHLDGTAPTDDIASVMTNVLGTNVFNCGIGGTCYNDGEGANFSQVADAITTGDWTLVDQRVNSAIIDNPGQGFEGQKINVEKVKALDFNNVDFITIAYGTNDLTYGALLDNDSNAFDKSTILGGLRYGVRTILETFPHIKIYVFTPCYRYGLGTNLEDSDTYVNSRGYKLFEIGDAIEECCKELHIACKNMYYCSNLNSYTKEIYMSDGVHRNILGYKLLGTQYAKFISAN